MWKFKLRPLSCPLKIIRSSHQKTQRSETQASCNKGRSKSLYFCALSPAILRFNNSFMPFVTHWRNSDDSKPGVLTARQQTYPDRVFCDRQQARELRRAWLQFTASPRWARPWAHPSAPCSFPSGYPPFPTQRGVSHRAWAAALHAASALLSFRDKTCCFLRAEDREHCCNLCTREVFRTD